jgi:hypothetical protein
VNREQFVNAFGVDLASPESRENTTGTAGDKDGPKLISFTEVGRRLVAVEVKGSIGSESDVLESTSVQGRSASAFWDAEGVVRFSCARDGEVVHDAELGEDADDLPTELAPVLANDPAAPSRQAVAMALVETWTETRVKAADIERALTLGYVAES